MSWEVIIAALISAISAIIVAWINVSAKKKPKPTVKSVKTEALPTPTADIKPSTIEIRTAVNWKLWIRSMYLFVVYIVILSPLANTSRIATAVSSTNLVLVIPVVTLIMSATWDINPLTAISVVLTLHALNLFIIWLTETKTVMYSSTLALVLLIFFLNALVVGAICRWRQHRIR